MAGPRTLRTSIVAGAASLMALTGCHTPILSPSPRDSAAPLRLATWNVHSCETGVQRVVNELRRLDAGVICLQEVIEPALAGDTDVPSQTRLIAERLGMHAYSRGGRLDERRRQCVVILSRGPLRDVEPLYAHEQRNYGVTAVIDWHGRPVRIVSVHLAGTYLLSWRHIVSTARQRGLEVRDLLRRLDQWRELVIVAGDFNMTRGVPAVESLARRLQFVQGPGATHPSHSPMLDLDRVLVSAGCRALSAAVVESTASDHRPVVAAVSIE